MVGEKKDRAIVSQNQAVIKPTAVALRAYLPSQKHDDLQSCTYTFLPVADQCVALSVLKVPCLELSSGKQSERFLAIVTSSIHAAVELVMERSLRWIHHCVKTTDLNGVVQCERARPVPGVARRG